MRSKIGWILAIVLGMIVLFLAGAFFLFIPRLLRLGFYGMHNYGMMGRGFGLFSPFGLLMWAIPAGVLILMVLGVAALINSLSRPAGPAQPPAAAMMSLPAVPAMPTAAVTADKACPNCSKPVQSDWNYCPYCGAGLR